MLRYIGNQIADVLDDVDYYGKRSLGYLTGKFGIEIAKEPLTQGLLAALPQGALGMQSKMAGFAIAAPLSLGLSAYFVQRDYRHQQALILDRYREEIGSWLGKDPQKVTQEDLQTAAKGDYLKGIPGNPALKQALQSATDERDLGFTVSAVSSLATTGIAITLKDSVKHNVQEWLESSTSLSGDLADVLVPLAMGAIGFGIYLAVKTPIHWLAEKLVGVEKTTVDDRIREMRHTLDQGRNVSQEKVLQAFIEAYPDIDKDIKQQYGRHFDKMDVKQKREVMLQLGPRLQLNEITQDINLGVMRPEELAFSMYGQHSGVAPKAFKSIEENQPGAFTRAWKRTVAAVRSTIGTKEKEHFVQDQTRPKEAIVELQSQDGREQLSLHAYDHETPEHKTSFVKMVGKRRASDGSMSFVEQVEHSRSSNTEAQIS